MQTRRASLTIAILLSLLAGFGIGYVSGGVMGFITSIRAEYGTANAIRDMASFVAAKKAWPKSWAELGSQPQSDVKINWSLDIKTCDRYDIMTSVAPVTDSFYTYPHAEQQLAELWQLILKMRQEPSMPVD